MSAVRGATTAPTSVNGPQLHESIRPLPINGAGSVDRPFRRAARYPWALHIASYVWQSGQLRRLAGKPPKPHSGPAADTADIGGRTNAGGR